ncbi:hypothetical protein GGTG_12812 [Gaeumannomyces tritici R3-111a-1]|uniref:Uncharacterized protein n=1 Tax=Gaeumannomyces tritici (strain R3-111a-1) TaxID=644352 RepID=J3PH32_GAET3|nr:hypothetical protein GGTG_12812 [Gaeumannomyces tritici R3-111a-1]EJT69929.1 hypothetical protein GGTG_12812 [Gaeumannomyces tritici R3-111a-1]
MRGFAGGPAPTTNAGASIARGSHWLLQDSEVLRPVAKPDKTEGPIVVFLADAAQPLDAGEVCADVVTLPGREFVERPPNARARRQPPGADAREESTAQYDEVAVDAW